MSPRLQATIDKVYKAFSWRALTSPLEVCHCNVCMSEEMARSILETPLRELSKEQLCEYTNSAHGWSDQFLALLPRYIDLIAQGQWPSYLDARDVLSRFSYAPENAMTPLETAAFEEWLLALFEETLLSPISSDDLNLATADHWCSLGDDICEVIDLALPTFFDTGRFRAIWESCEAREATLRLAGIVISDDAKKHFLRGWFHSEAVKQEAVRWHDWFAFADHGERFAMALERETDPRAQELLLAAI